MKQLLVLSILCTSSVISRAETVRRKARRNPFAESREVVAERDAFKREQQRKKNAAALKKYARYCGLGETDDAIIVFVEWKGELYDFGLGDTFGKIWSITMIDDDYMQVESVVDGDQQKLYKA